MKKSLLPLIALLSVTQTEGWISGSHAHEAIQRRQRPRRRTQSFSPTCNIGMVTLSGGSDDPLNQQESDVQQQQRMILEEISLNGAEKIAQMGIPERAKRAMLAEAVEDRIFELTEVLEGLIEEDGTVAEGNRKKVIDIANKTKNLQQEYSDLVNGGPSTVLSALDSMASGRNEN